MSAKGDKAENFFKQGYNCSQSVILAFAQDIGLDPKTALMFASPFGGGMGRMREVCGAVSAMFMVLGLKYGYSDPCDKAAKTELYKQVQFLADEFRTLNGSIICKEILLNSKNNPSSDYVPSERTDEYYKKRPCAKTCRIAADILDKYIKNRESIDPED